MKKISILSIAVLAMTFASCKKDRTCKCTVTDDSPGATTSEYTVVYKNVSDASAKSACMSLQVKPDGQPYTETRTCTLQ